MNPRSIRFRLTFWYGLALFLALLAFGMSIWGFMTWTLRVGKLQTLAHRADRLEILVREQSDVRRTLWVNSFAPVMLGLPEGAYTQIFSADGKRLVPSETSAPSLPWPEPELGSGFGAMNARGMRFRTIERKIQVQGVPLTLRLASQYEDNDRLLKRLEEIMAAMVPVVLVLSSFGGYMLSRRALRPMEQLARTAEQIGLHDLSRPLPIPNTGDEVQHVAEIFNSLLRRLDGAIGRQRRFTADASHHLRTPLATARVTAEIALSGQPSSQNFPEVLEEILVEINEMEEIVNGMLQLARLEAEGGDMPVSRIDLAPLLLGACQRMTGAVEARGLTLAVEVSPVEEMSIMANDASLRRLMMTLIDNAIRYTPAGGITVRATKRAHDIECTVSDTGIGIAVAALPHVFERFFRASPAQMLVSNGSGLGLSIAKWTVERHGGKISAESVEGKGTTICFTLPRATTGHESVSGNW